MDSLIDDLVALVPQCIDDELQSAFACRGRDSNPVGPHDAESQLSVCGFSELNRTPGNGNALTYGIVNEASNIDADREMAYGIAVYPGFQIDKPVTELGKVFQALCHRRRDEGNAL